MRELLQLLAGWLGLLAVLGIFWTLLKSGAGDEHDDDGPPPPPSGS